MGSNPVGSLQNFMFIIYSPSCKFTNFLLSHIKKANKYQSCFFDKTSLNNIPVFVLTSASLSRCTPAKSNASLRKPCLSVRSIDAITARHSCHILFQFPRLSGSEGVELPWDWDPDLGWEAFQINSKFGLVCYMYYINWA